MDTASSLDCRLPCLLRSDHYSKLLLKAGEKGPAEPVNGVHQNRRMFFDLLSDLIPGDLSISDARDLLACVHQC
ncbi:hypothetical protein D3C71_2215490 [compost metagenome]